MGIKKYKPITPALRFKTGYDFSEITKTNPEKSLLKPLKKSGGRNNSGRITVRFRGGGHKRLYRIIDFKRNKLDVEAEVIGIEYDPNRTARIALLRYPDGEKRYIIAPLGLSVGEKIMSTYHEGAADIKVGNCLPLRYIPLGTFIHNIELQPGKGAQIVRAAGSSAQIMAKEGKYAQVKLPSGEVRLILLECRAVIGQIGNVEHNSIIKGKAGRSAWLGKRPHVRGVAMNPVDHPHGGGEGKAGQGNPQPVTPWGEYTKGKKTRKRKHSDKYIIKRRRNKR